MKKKTVVEIRPNGVIIKMDKPEREITIVDLAKDLSNPEDAYMEHTKRKIKKSEQIGYLSDGFKITGKYAFSSRKISKEGMHNMAEAILAYKKANEKSFNIAQG